MKIDFFTPITMFDGTAIAVDQAPDSPFRNASSVCVDALLTSYQDEIQLTGEKKMQRYILAKRIYSGGQQDVTIDEAKILKELVGKRFGPLIVGQIYELLEGDNK